MSLAPLATTADLSDRNITYDSTKINISAFLESASSAIRAAAGSLISAVSTTIAVPGGPDEWLDLPTTVTQVESVLINDQPVEGWKLRSGRLWRSNGWCPGRGNDVEVTGSFGVTPTPADIVDLCCSLVAGALVAAEDGYDPQRGLSSLGIDDYREGYARGDDEVINPLQLPERTELWLRRRFGGGGTYVTRSR